MDAGERQGYPNYVSISEEVRTRPAYRPYAATVADVQRLSPHFTRVVFAGEDFDVAFVQKMIPHHQSGIIEFLEPQSRAPHAQLRVAATAGITTQQAQVADFRTWLAGRS